VTDEAAAEAELLPAAVGAQRHRHRIRAEDYDLEEVF
jgi:hypothetical protein